MAETRDLTVPNLLFLSLQTSGLYREDKPLTDPAQPWVMQCAAMLCNQAGSVANHFSVIIKADGRTAKETAVQVHGISAWATTQIGVPEPRLVGLLSDLLKTVPMTGMKVISYGDMDPKVISSLFAKFGEKQKGDPAYYARLWAARPGTEFINLMHPWCQEICKLPSSVEGATEHKWPSLDEAAEIILGRPRPEGFRDAYDNLCRTRDLYFALAAKGMLRVEEAA